MAIGLTNIILLVPITLLMIEIKDKTTEETTIKDISKEVLVTIINGDKQKKKSNEKNGDD